MGRLFFDFVLKERLEVRIDFTNAHIPRLIVLNQLEVDAAEGQNTDNVQHCRYCAEKVGDLPDKAGRKAIAYCVKNSPANQDNWMHYSLRQMNENPKMKSAVLNFLSELDTGIEDIQVKIDEKKLDPSELPPFLSDEFRAMILQNNINAITARVVYDRFDIDLMQEESTGIQKLFGILCPIIDIMTNGKVLICDELESSLHESLVFGLVKLFMNTQTDKFAQMIFTTHETGLLNLDLFRRDQIWFAEMRKDDRSTDLYSLAEIKNVRKEDNFGRGYISGKYGAIPMLNLNFADIVSEM